MSKRKFYRNGKKMSMEEYLLTPFSKEELDILFNVSFRKAKKILNEWKGGEDDEP